MSLVEKQQQLIAKFRPITDAYERLSGVVARGKKWPPVTQDERTDAHRVAGCASRVWLAGSVEDGRARFRMDADSPLVKGLVALLCELYDGGRLDEVATVEPEIFEALGIAQQLSPTRLNGLACVRKTIREFALHSLPA